MAMTLVVGAGLLVRSFLEITSVEVGFDSRNVVAARVTLPADAPLEEPSAEEMVALIDARTRFFQEVRGGVQSLPGVERVAMAWGLPFGRYGFSRPVTAEEPATRGDPPTVDGNVVSAEYFRVMGIPVVRGRGFTPADDRRAPQVIIVNQALADLLWPGEDVVGKRVRLGDDSDAPWWEVIGVVSNTHLRSLTDDPEPLYYNHLPQAAWPSGMFVVVRMTGKPGREAGAGTVAGDFLTSLRRTVWSLDPAVTITEVVTAADLVASSVAEPRFRTMVLSAFGAVAILLAVLGIYGVSAFAVSERTREIGVRMALGAGYRRVVGMVVWGSVGLAILGVGLGLAGALALSRFLSGMLFGLTAFDPLTYAAAALFIVCVAVVAAYGPARRAAAIEPLSSLRLE
jgi:putative ABC transport system permease protein